MEDSEDLDQASKRLQRLLRENHDSQDNSAAAAATAEGGSVKKVPALRKKSSIYTNLSNPGKFTQIDVGSVKNTVDDYDLDQEEERKRAEQILQNMNSCFEDEGNKATSSSSVNLTNPSSVATLHTKTPITDQSKSLSNSQVLASTNQMSLIEGNAANVQPSQTTPRTKQGRSRQRRDLHKTTSGTALSNKVPTQVPTIQHPGISVPGIHLTTQHTGITFTNQHPGTAAQGMTNQYQGFSAQGMTLTNQSHAYGLTNQRQPQDIGTWIKYKPTRLSAAEWIQYRLTDTQTGQGPKETCHCITAMPEYEAKSLEELRCEDYLINRRGRQHDSPVPHISPRQQPSTAVIPSHLKYGKGLTSIKTIQTDIIPSTDSSGHMHLCESHITGSCRKHLCEFYHNSTSRLPYEWKVSLNGIWYKIIASEELEEAYCDLSYKGVQIEIVKEHEWCCIYLEFKDPTFLSHIHSSNNLQLCPVEIRRLSTLSYVQGNLIEPGFKTQWRWYWQDDSETWNLYEKVLTAVEQERRVSKGIDAELQHDVYEPEFTATVFSPASSLDKPTALHWFADISTSLSNTPSTVKETCIQEACSFSFQTQTTYNLVPRKSVGRQTEEHMKTSVSTQTQTDLLEIPSPSHRPTHHTSFMESETSLNDSRDIEWTVSDDEIDCENDNVMDPSSDIEEKFIVYRSHLSKGHNSTVCFDRFIPLFLL